MFDVGFLMQAVEEMFEQLISTAIKTKSKRLLDTVEDMIKKHRDMLEKHENRLNEAREEIEKTSSR